MPQPSQRHSLAAKPPRTRGDPLLSFLTGAEGADVVIDMAEIDRLDSQRLRVLLSAQAHWRARGAQFRLTGLSDTAAAGLRRLGLPDGQFETEDLG